MECGAIFFFSSRRRHTRLQGDWSSDVCSSDLRSDQRISSQRAHQPGAFGAWGTFHLCADADRRERLSSRLGWRDRKSTRLNSSHLVISYAVFCLKKKKYKPKYTPHMKLTTHIV